MSPFLISVPSTKSRSSRNAVTRATRSTRSRAWMRPLISVVSFIGRYSATITPTAGAPPAGVCAISGEIGSRLRLASASQCAEREQVVATDRANVRHVASAQCVHISTVPCPYPQAAACKSARPHLEI